MNRQQPIIVKGVTLYPIHDKMLRSYLENPNLVILIADKSKPTIPVYYQRYADYIDKASLDNIGLCSIERIIVINDKDFPISTEYAMMTGLVVDFYQIDNEVTYYELTT